MQATSKNVLFPGHNHLLTISRPSDDPTSFLLSPKHQRVKGHQYRWLADGYDLEIEHSLEVASMVVTWCIVGFLCSASYQTLCQITQDFSSHQVNGLLYSIRHRV